MFKFIADYHALIPPDKLPSNGPTFSISDTGDWCQFVWDIVPKHDYLRAPNDWLEVTKFGGSEVIVSGVSRSVDGLRVIKVEFIQHIRKRNNLLREAEIISQLNLSNCVSAPNLLSSGVLPLDAMYAALPSEWACLLEDVGIVSFRYLILEYVESTAKVSLADILVAIMEQKSLGVYHGDVKPDNLRFDNNRGVCILIDYGQAILLSSDIKKLNAEEYLKWSDVYDKENYPFGPGKWARHFKGLHQKLHVNPLLCNGALNLAKTTSYKRQASTNTKSGVYHTIKHPVVFADGVRDLHDRSLLLDQVEFAPGEIVLDVGCNAGLLVHYLAKRGCVPIGLELDSSIVISAQLIANIMEVKARFFSNDLDEMVSLEPCDTVCLFSVIHHTSKLIENGVKIANACKRILIECRLSEHGKKPMMQANGKIRWENTSIWQYSDEEQLFNGLSNLFPGFKVVRRIGRSDKNRILIEMKKTGVAFDGNILCC